MSSAVLRADASKKIGLGHLSRAIAMARTLERGGTLAKVFVRELDPGCAAAKMRGHADIAQLVRSEDEFLSVLERREARHLFIDLFPGPEYAELSKRLRPFFHNYRTICFDTFFDNELPFDLFVRPLFDGKATEKNALVGLKYYVFPEELREMAQLKKARPMKHALISLGGSDPHRATSFVARELCAAFPGLKFHVVIGPGFASEERAELKNLTGRFANLELIIEPENLGSLYLDCDLAVTSGGLTKFETALFGIPTLIVANSPQEEELSREFAAHGASVVLGRAERLDAGRLKAEFGLMMDPKRAAEMSKKGHEMLDIHGGERVIEHIKKNLS